MSASQNPQKKSRKSWKHSLEGEEEEEQEEEDEQEEESEQIHTQRRRRSSSGGKRGANAATTAAERGVTNHRTNNTLALARDVANALKLCGSYELFKLVEEYAGKVPVLGEAFAARAYVDNPQSNKRRKEMSVSYFRDWLERGQKWKEEDKVKERRAELVGTLREYINRRAG